LEDLCASHPDRTASLALDVTDLSTIADVVEKAIGCFGRIDVLVNNAGRGYVGAVEETSHDELHAAMMLHFYGPAALMRAVLPHMRSRRTGAIIQMSSLAGRVSYAGMGVTSASKFALEGMTEALAAEVAPLGIKVLIVEPGSFRTNASSPKVYHRSHNAIADYQQTSGVVTDIFAGTHGQEPGDPRQAARAIITALDHQNTPLRLLMGNDAFDLAMWSLDQGRASMLEWEKVTRNLAFTDAPNVYQQPPAGTSWATTEVERAGN
jgi:NAD(P)-dependent dehydrogenase (short-subunit alcohol dehydrogenase family)